MHVRLVGVLLYLIRQHEAPWSALPAVCTSLGVSETSHAQCRLQTTNHCIGHARMTTIDDMQAAATAAAAAQQALGAAGAAGE